MKEFLRLCSIALFALVLASAGCGNDDHAGDKHDAMTTEHGSGGVESNGLMDLSLADRALVEAQGTCPVSDERLGSMGTPVKVTHGDKTIFLCCENCVKKFQRDAEKYLAKLKK